MRLRVFLLCGAAAILAATPAMAQGNAQFLASLAAMPRMVAQAPADDGKPAERKSAGVSPAARPHRRRAHEAVAVHQGNAPIGLAREIAAQRTQIAALTARLEALRRQVASLAPAATSNATLHVEIPAGEPQTILADADPAHPNTEAAQALDFNSLRSLVSF